ncbi:MAG: UTP--glucose-1-phosphate uridylyltransferase [Coprobacillus sp.]|nr:UTP--glucose-1-phosphate uridylyltransferase [Coprobacillus sp.]
MSDNKITKAVITAAGYGTRFLPITKGVGKEMLPIIDKPIILYLVEEAVKSGITDIYICTLKDKKEIEQFFKKDPKYEKYLRSIGKADLADSVHYVTHLANIKFIYQKTPKGLGYTISTVEKYTQDEPFVVLLGDDLIVTDNETEPVTKQLIDAYEKCECSILGVQQVDASLTHKYGIIKPGKINGRLIEVKAMVEKPKDNPPSKYAALGRYILTPEIFGIIHNLEPGVGGEIQLTDALAKLANLYAYDFVGTRYDCGDKLSYVTATIDLSLKREDIGEQVKKHIDSLK